MGKNDNFNCFSQYYWWVSLSLSLPFSNLFLNLYNLISWQFPITFSLFLSHTKVPPHKLEIQLASSDSTFHSVPFNRNSGRTCLNDSISTLPTTNSSSNTLSSKSETRTEPCKRTLSMNELVTLEENTSATFVCSSHGGMCWDKSGVNLKAPQEKNPIFFLSLL